MTAKTRRLLVAFLLAATIAFAACGGSSGGSRERLHRTQPLGALV